MSRALCLLFHDVFERSPAESGFAGAAAARYKLPVRDFERQLAGLADARDDAPILLDRETPAGRRRPPFAITVDDGGVSFYTLVAERLENLGWRGHCLVTTGSIGRPGFLDRTQIRELRRRGHTIGSHSVSHPVRFSACPWGAMVKEWRESRQMLADLLGENIGVASVPGGYYSPRVAAAAREAGFRVLFTSEPELRVGTVDGCLVIGRFTVRRGSPPDFAARLGLLRPSARLREWVVWNGKKMAKGVLGAAYPRLARARPWGHCP